MADDRIDWASVMAVHAMSVGVANCAGYEYPPGETPVPGVLAALTHPVEPEAEAVHLAIAAALREAFEAGLRERIDGLDCDACGERHMTERGAEMASENRELRREVEKLRTRIARAFDMATNRWSEWGDRAVTVAEILAGDYDPEDPHD